MPVAIPTAEHSSFPWHFWAARASDLGAGEGQASTPCSGGRPRSFFYSCGLGFGRADVWRVVLPSAGADPFPIPGCPGPPIRALIEV
jgi:hypothetical protein